MQGEGPVPGGLPRTCTRATHKTLHMFGGGIRLSCIIAGSGLSADLVVAADVGGAEARDAALGHDQRRARLRAGRHLQVHAPLHRLHLRGCARTRCHILGRLLHRA